VYQLTEIEKCNLLLHFGRGTNEVTKDHSFSQEMHYVATWNIVSHQLGLVEACIV